MKKYWVNKFWNGERINHIPRSLRDFFVLLFMSIVFNINVSINSSDVNISFYLVERHHDSCHNFCLSYSNRPKSDGKLTFVFWFHVLYGNDVSSINNSRHYPKIIKSFSIKEIKFLPELDTCIFWYFLPRNCYSFRRWFSLSLGRVRLLPVFF